MDGISQLPAWLGTAMLGAIIAAIGYVSKLFLDWFGAVQMAARSRQAKLVQLFAHLRATKTAYVVQCEHRSRLDKLITQRNPPGLPPLERGYEQRFTAAYPTMTEEEKVLHTMLRAITIYTLCPLNESILKWVGEDTYFKARTWGRGPATEVARKLAILESHLLLWRAKYAVWIPDNSAHALVFLVDEQRHGVGFPTGIEKDVESLLKRKWWSHG